MDAPRYFARRYFAGRYWPPATDVPLGYMSGTFAGSSTFVGRLTNGAAVEQEDDGGIFIGRSQRRKRREEKDLQDLYAIVNRMMQEAA